jgi:uncharacterized BrkB/YihY/UPF0761 family membrane protein
VEIMSENEEPEVEAFWRNKIKEFKWIFLILIIAAICIITGVILVLIWFIETTPIGFQGTATVGQWTLDWVVGFIILLCLWELLFVGVPTVLFFGIGGYLWWRRLPDEKKEEFKSRDKKEKKHRKEKAGGSGGFGIVMLIAYCLYHGIMGTYKTPFGALPYTYWIYSYLLTIMWMVIVLGGPIVIILIIVYFVKWRK